MPFYLCCSKLASLLVQQDRKNISLIKLMKKSSFRPLQESVGLLPLQKSDWLITVTRIRLALLMSKTKAFYVVYGNSKMFYKF